MEREHPDVEDTVVVNRDDAELDRTIVRPRRHRDAGTDAADTILVDRGRADIDETILVDRRPASARLDDDDDDDDTDRTIARPSHDDDTILVDRGAPPVSLPPVPSLRRARPERRRGIAPPPIPAGFAPAARPAVGPGAVEHYTPRRIAPPPDAPVAPEGIAAGRVIDPDLPSVARRARRTTVVALAAFAGACLVSATGLALILIWAL